MKKSDRERRTDASTCKMMPADWTPGPYEVLIGRGRRCTMHWGNQRFRAMIDSELSGYTAAQDCKRQKSSIIGRVLADIQHHSPHAGFVKKDVGTGRWLSLTDAASRVTIAQAFRDALVDTYRSSKHSKQVKRRIEKRERQSPASKQAKREQREREVHVVPETTAASPPPSGGCKQPAAFDEISMPPLKPTVTWDSMEEMEQSPFHDSFTLIASTVADVVSDDEPSESGSEIDILANEEFDALFQAFAGDEVNMEDNPFEPLPLSSAGVVPEPTPFPTNMMAASVIPQPTPLPLSPLRRYSPGPSSPRQMFKRGGVLGNTNTPFGSTVPFRDVRAAMSA